ncbi:hypothetical protein BC628DRAFT_1408922 [Trametes gibbosa]|nr:hypothetical protein BC628DRAFT_1408922 [Trametes gibbosa]
MSGHKRPLSPEVPSTQRTRAKRVATVCVPDDDEDSLDDILAQIKAQEESEELARKLQAEWNAPGPSRQSTAVGGSAPCDVIVISDDELEDDEAMARRLATEWGVEDDVPRRPPSTSYGDPSPSKGKASSDDDPIPSPMSVLEQYRELFIGERACLCGSKSCHTVVLNHCRACMSPVACQLSCKGKQQDESCSVDTCCTDVRAIALFEAIGGFDRQYLGERTVANERAREAAAKARTMHVNNTGQRGIGYGTGHGADHSHDFNNTAMLNKFDLFSAPSHPSFGRGRGYRRRGHTSSYMQPDRGATRHELSAAHFDQVIVRALNTITYYLPSPYSENAQILLLLSQVPDLLASLLRNDSVTDWIARIDVYQAMLALLRRLADCELTLEVLTGPRWEMTRSCGLEDWMWGHGQIVWERDPSNGELVAAPPLYTHFKKLTKQCEAFLAGASGMSEFTDDGEDAITMVKATSLCGDIIAVKEDIKRAMVTMGKDPASVLTAFALTSESQCERSAFQHVSLSRSSANQVGLDYPEYYYVDELVKTAHATRNPKDRLHLVKELAVMATSLPPGVWVRVDEVRNDVIKIMIAGPEGTPYAGGLFEFDCFIPLEYPNRPPLMHLRTTGQGTVRFNPNLYNDGKVCLSLLGTWKGRPEEKWSRKSTLLQVLVSIQSMILVDYPYFNEPGFGRTNPHDKASIDYNKNIMLQTTRWAIVDWLQDKHKRGLWADVIVSHFLTRHDKIAKCIQQWVTAVPSIRACSTDNAAPTYMAGDARLLLPTSSFGNPNLSSYGNGWPEPIYTGPSSLSRTPAGGSRFRQTQQSVSPKVDLVAEFQAGIKRVRTWVLMKTGE